MSKTFSITSFWENNGNLFKAPVEGQSYNYGHYIKKSLNAPTDVVDYLKTSKAYCVDCILNGTKKHYYSFFGAYFVGNFEKSGLFLTPKNDYSGFKYSHSEKTNIHIISPEWVCVWNRIINNEPLFYKKNSVPDFKKYAFLKSPCVTLTTELIHYSVNKTSSIFGLCMYDSQDPLVQFEGQKANYARFKIKNFGSDAYKNRWIDQYYYVSCSGEYT